MSSPTKSKKPSITLNEASNGHFYTVIDRYYPDGIDLPSATTILECFPNPGLKLWLEQTSPEVITKKQEDGKKQGTKVHHLCHLLSLGQEIMATGITEAQAQLLGVTNLGLLSNLSSPLTVREANCLAGFENYWEDLKPITLLKEEMVYSHLHGFAGTLDWCGYLYNKKEKKYELWIIDYKISNNHSRDYELQISAYYEALKELKRKKKLTAKLGLLYLGKATKKKYLLKEVTEISRKFEMFLTTKKIFDFLHPNAKPVSVSVQAKYTVDTSHKLRTKKVKL